MIKPGYVTSVIGFNHGNSRPITRKLGYTVSNKDKKRGDIILPNMHICVNDFILFPPCLYTNQLRINLSQDIAKGCLGVKSFSIHDSLSSSVTD